MHFSEILKLQFEKKTAIHCFVFYCFLYAWFAQLSFWISIALAKICFSRIVINLSFAQKCYSVFESPDMPLSSFVKVTCRLSSVISRDICL